MKDGVSLEVLSTKSNMRSSKEGKIGPRYSGPYEIVRKAGQTAYKLDLSPDLESVHPIFRASMLRKCVGDSTRIVPVSDVQVTEKLAYDERPMVILDRQVRRLRNKEVASVKNL